MKRKVTRLIEWNRATVFGDGTAYQSSPRQELISYDIPVTWRYDNLPFIISKCARWLWNKVL